MFDFFRKKKEQRQAAAAQEQAVRQVLAQLERGESNALEAALALHLGRNNQDSLAQFLLYIGTSDLWLLNRSDERLGDPAGMQGKDNLPYIAAFSSQERATTAAAEWQMPNHPSSISTLELVFTLNASIGIMLNANDPHFQWVFTPQHVNYLRSLYVKSWNYNVGGIYSVWSQGIYRAAKVLAVDEGGVHLRVYANAWTGRPAAIDPAELTLERAHEDFPRAIGHMPLVRRSFLAMGPKLAGEAPVLDSELEGHVMWAESEGGYFDT